MRSSGVPVWMHPHDDISKGKFNIGCCIDKTLKESDQTLQEEWTQKSVTYEFQNHFFSKKEKITFVCNFLRFVAIEKYVGQKQVTLKRAPCHYDWQPKHAIDSNLSIKAMMSGCKTPVDGDGEPTMQMEDTGKQKAHQLWKVKTQHLSK